MDVNTADKSAGIWTGLRALEAEIQAGLAQDGLAMLKLSSGVKPPLSWRVRAEPKLRPLISGMAVLGLVFAAWLAGPESRPSTASALGSAPVGSVPAYVDAGGGRAAARPVALRPALPE
jgi:hypothetical protein